MLNLSQADSDEWRDDYTRLEKEKREALEQARFLYEVARGDYSGKVNFERYVLAYYFENVIQTANLRLEQMTNSRYTLIRRTQKNMTY